MKRKNQSNSGSARPAERVGLSGPWSLVSGLWSSAKRSGVSGLWSAKRSGFALLIVVTLLAFLVVLLIGLAAYTRIETAVAGNTQRQAQARENALLALNVALGQLQKYAGPDQRVTATAASAADVNGQKPHYTGVWHSDVTATADPVAPLAWLVSGIERGIPQDISVAIPAAERAELVGVRSTGAANSVVAPLQDIRVAGIPGSSPSVPTPIGRYAWWVGDQGVKAPVAVSDRTDVINYPPYDSPELHARIRQQIGLGAGAADANGTAIFEPHDTNNKPLARNDKITATNQLAFLKNSSGLAIGLTGARGLQRNFFAWSPNNFAVLANTKLGGLKGDLSLKPDLLGGGFAAWADYESYIEDPLNPLIPVPIPEYSAIPIRRRYRIVPPSTLPVPTSGVAPVLSSFLLNFNVRTVGGATTQANIEVRMRWIAGLWNPYSAAFVPEDLRVEVDGLPPTIEFAPDPANPAVVVVPFGPLFGSTLDLKLPWDHSRADLVGQPDVASWLPGRVYQWASIGNASAPNDGYFYSKDLTRSGQSSIVTRLTNESIVGDTPGGWRVTTPTALTVRLIRASDDAVLATYRPGDFEPFFAVDPTALPPQASNGNFQFSYFFRLDTSAPGAWLTSPGRDPRSESLGSDSFVFGNDGPRPELYALLPSVSNPDWLLDRSMSSSTTVFNEDVPVFELPRAPLLSLGILQHIEVPGARPFAIGNPWAAGVQIDGNSANGLFDRFFFSGMATPVVRPLDDEAFGMPFNLPTPNSLLLTVRRKNGGEETHLSDIARRSTALDIPRDGFSSAHMLQGAAFNVNSVNREAWVAILRGARFPIGKSLDVLDTDLTGTSGDTTIPVDPLPTGASFFRFSQSAQETLKADLPREVAGVRSTYAASTTTSPADPDVISQANSHLFRRGMKALSAEQIAALAAAIVDRVSSRLGNSGPFRSIEEFLNEGILDASIADIPSINQDADGTQLEFSSQWLTQADIMTALAPILFPRSDTFLIRTYGEVINPATQAVEGRAWCEATVQRVPEFFDPTDPPETPIAAFDATVDPDDPASQPTAGHQLNKLLGRRFKVVSFRWLTRSDI